MWQRERRMYDKDVLEPRLVAAWSGDGRTQHEWQHTVPKAAKAGARMSVTMRHSRPVG